ncbi:MAG TPA: SDR family NAD(P)-dependent oxidoreductase [Candidatus Acidoferrales bacterium]|nr:SDR family NAD(P)-dependent oxidoreductase [Candidatus Acidoferrales bacterium]
MDLGLKGKAALVTGATRGLGYAMARALLEEGVNIGICARDADKVGAVAKELSGLASTHGAQALELAGDVTKAADAERIVTAMVARFGGVDILVNNAGAARPGALAELPESAWQEQFDLNLFAPVRLARLCAPSMEKRGGGSIVNIGSIYGRESGGPLTYNASKAALHSFTKMLARELAPKNIRVNTIAPGSILAPGGNWERRFKENPAFEKDFISHEMPAGRLGRPDEVAYAVVMLASPRASWITGACIPVDGAQGRSIA